MIHKSTINIPNSDGVITHDSCIHFDSMFDIIFDSMFDIIFDIIFVMNSVVTGKWRGNYVEGHDENLKVQLPYEGNRSSLQIIFITAEKKIMGGTKMSKILIADAGGAPSENVIKSLIEGDSSNEIIGMGSDGLDLMLSSATKKYCVPYAIDARYKSALLTVLNSEKPDLVHFQNDFEIREASRMREDIMSTGTKIYMPSKETIETCVDKCKTSLIWESEGIKIPKTVVVHSEKDLKKAFDTLGNKEGKIWIRAAEGGGGIGALPADNYEFAKMWIDKFKGWGNFTAAQLLDTNSVTWLWIWYEGELVVAQTRKRHSWYFGNRTLSGVTGVTRVGETCSDDTVNIVAMESILSIDKKPHGIYGVDMTYDFDGFPNPTEINISRFFTTVYFFTKAGLNMPQIFIDIALHDKFPSLEKKINPLQDGLLWIRGMDREPILTSMEEINGSIIEV